MNSQLKKSLKFGLFSGLGYAVIMAAFEFTDGAPFSIGYFLFNFFFFGLAMSFGINYEKRMIDKK